ncbi:MAG: cupin domain-containing protein [Blautia sp.]|nr:cupin domain-containing protein [Blautia sp.]
MIRRKEECAIEYREHMRDGDGTVKLTNLISGPKDLCDKGRLFSVIRLEPGCSIGYHIHEHDSELFYIVQGKGVYSDNGHEADVYPGDVMICPPGQGHSMANRSDEPLEFVAVIVYE